MELIPKIFLASQSPRRKELLARAGYDFEVLEPDPTAECGICSRETPPEMVARLAFQKAANVVCKLERTGLKEGWVLACDTVAECMGAMLGKPENRDHAKEMLLRLRGRPHSVYSGIALWDLATNRRSVQVDVSKLAMLPIQDEELESYLDTDAWVGKSGAFGFQDGPPWLVLKEGSPTNVVGLPMEMLEKMLANFKHPTNR